MSGIKTSLQEQKEDLEYFADAIEYFETHDLSEELANSPEVHFTVSPQAKRRRYPLDTKLSAKLDKIAEQRGVPAEMLINEWVREKTDEFEHSGAVK